MFKRFLQSTSGNFGLALAAASPALLLGVGFSIDVTNLMSAKADLQNALDAAVMASARPGAVDVPRLDTFEAFFQSNVAGKQLLRDPAASLEVTETIASIRNRGVARSHVDLKFMPFFNMDPLITVSSTAYESRKNIEVALVLDNTGSMGADRMRSLREAANSLVDTLRSMQSGSARQVRAALVPFVTAVNVKGEGFKDSWIDRTGANPLNGIQFNQIDGRPADHLQMFDRLGVAWKGCVEARPAPHNLDDSAPNPSDPATLFVPYFAPDEPGPWAAAGNEATRFNNSYLSDSAPATSSTSSATVVAQQRAEQKSVTKYNRTTPRRITETPSLTSGPNRACATPIAPLTQNLASLKTAIDAMTFWNGSGTNVSEGLAWGRRVLSPTEPYTQGQDFSDPLVSKTVVIFTDGTNEVYGSSDTFNKSDYGAYAFLADARMGSASKAAAITQVNSWTQQMCTELKGEDVQIFTILLGADSGANRTLYSQCASKPEYYFATNDAAKLKAIFGSIADTIAQLQFTN